MQTTYSDNRWSVSLASEECNIIHSNHHTKKGRIGSETFSSSAADDFCQMSPGQHKVGAIHFILFLQGMPLFWRNVPLPLVVDLALHFSLECSPCWCTFKLIRSVRSSAALALGKLSALSPRIDPLVNDLLSNLQVMLVVFLGAQWPGKNIM